MIQVLTKERKRRRASLSDDSADDVSDGVVEKPKKKRRSKKAKDGNEDRPRIPRKKPGEDGYNPYDFDSEEEDSQGEEALVMSLSLW